MGRRQINKIRKQLADWFASELGQQTLRFEKEKLESVLPQLFGFHILQVGFPNKTDYLCSSKIFHKSYLCFTEDELDSSKDTFLAEAENIPLASDSIDVVVLPHVFEYSNNPHRLLRELDRILIDDGHLVILGINRFSLWGLWYVFLCWWNNMPWSGRLISIPRMKDWLSLLDFEVKKVKYCFYSPPLKKPTWLKRCQPLERFGARCWPILGGIYVIVGKKRVVPLNPIKMNWQKQKKLLGSSVAEPSTRQILQRND